MRLDKEEKRKLLEYFAAKLGCLYLSDLHQHCYLKRIHRLLPDINPESYSIAEWNDAILYLTGQKKNFKTQIEAKLFLENVDFSDGSGEEII